MMLMVAYGLNIGVYYAISTLLNQIIKPTLVFGGEIECDAKIDQYIGYMAAVSLILIGIIGTFISGLVLDKFKKFKATTIFIYVFTLS